MATDYGVANLPRVANGRDPLLGAIASGLQRGLGRHRIALFLEGLPRVQNESFCRRGPLYFSIGGPGKRSVLRRVSRRHLCAVIRISRDVAKESMGFICDRIIVCRSLDAVLGGRDVLLSIEIGPRQENVIGSAKGKQRVNQLHWR